MTARRSLLPAVFAGAALAAAAAAAGENAAIRPGAAAPAVPPSADPSDGLLAIVRTGPLPPGAILRVETPDGTLLGSVAPFGAAAARTGTSATIPIPPSAVADDHVPLRLRVVAAGASRPARADEIVGIELVDD